MAEILSEGRDVVAVPTPGQARSAGRHVMVAIGIDRYRHWRPLSNAVGDALGAAALFRRLGFDEVVPPLLDERATHDAIEALVTDELMALDPSDSLIVFYAGHGGTRTQRVGEHTVRTGYLIPVDGAGEAGRVQSWIEIDPWLRRISKLPPRHILVILDACFSGIALSSAIKWGRDSGALLDLPFATANTRPSRLVITSALNDERAMDSGPVPGHSLFTGCLIEALTGGLAPVGTRHGRRVTIGSELGRYVRNRVQTYRGRPGWQQTPDLGTFDFDERGEMLIPVLIGDDLAAAPASLARGSAERISVRPTTEPLDAEPVATKAVAMQTAIDASATQAVATDAVALETAANAPVASQAGGIQMVAVVPSSIDALTAEAAAIDAMAIDAVSIETTALETMAIAAGDAEVATPAATAPQAAMSAGPELGTSRRSSGPLVATHIVEVDHVVPGGAPRATRSRRRLWRFLLVISIAIGVLAGVVVWRRGSGSPSVAARSAGSPVLLLDERRAPVQAPVVPSVEPARTEHLGADTPVQSPATPFFEWSVEDHIDGSAPDEHAAAEAPRNPGVAPSRAEVPRRPPSVPARAATQVAAAAPANVPTAPSRICPTRIDTPKDAEVSWNGLVATVPTELRLPCDVEVELAFRKPHYLSATRTVTASRGGKPVVVHLQKEKLSVYAASTPEGATITVARRSIGVTPATILLPAFETSTVTFTRDGYAPVAQKVNPERDGSQLHVTLAPVAPGTDRDGGARR